MSCIKSSNLYFQLKFVSEHKFSRYLLIHPLLNEILQSPEELRTDIIYYDLFALTLTDGKRPAQHKTQETNKVKQIAIRNLKRNNVNKVILRTLKVISCNKDIERAGIYLHSPFIMKIRKASYRENKRVKIYK